MMPWIWLAIGLILIWGALWYLRTQSWQSSLIVMLRLGLMLGIIYLSTRLVWRIMVPAGVCPITTPPDVLIVSILVPVGLVIGLSYLSSYLPQMVVTDDGFSLFTGEDYHFRAPVTIESLGKNRYQFLSQGKTTKVTMRGSLAKKLIAQIQSDQDMT